jgi:hypothetical protein
MLPGRKVCFGEGDAIENCSIEKSRCSRMSAMETCGKAWGMYIVMGDPAVVTCVIPFPFYQIFQVAVAHLTVQNFFDFKFFITADENWRWWRDGPSSWNRVHFHSLTIGKTRWSQRSCGGRVRWYVPWLTFASTR